MLLKQPNDFFGFLVIPFNLVETGFYKLNKKSGVYELIGVLSCSRREFYQAFGKKLEPDLKELILKHFFQYDQSFELELKILLDYPEFNYALTADNIF